MTTSAVTAYLSSQNIVIDSDSFSEPKFFSYDGVKDLPAFLAEQNCEFVHDTDCSHVPLSYSAWCELA